MKICKKCKKEKSETDFYPASSGDSRDGLMARCKECYKEYQRDWQLKSRQSKNVGALLKEPQDIGKNAWYYEEKQGIRVVCQLAHGEYFHAIIPWHMLVLSVGRASATPSED